MPDKPNPFKIISGIPLEYTELVDAVSEFFYACGSRELCGACFRGELLDNGAFSRWNDERKILVSGGCCGTCPALGAEGCKQKPLGCAVFTCERLSFLVPDRLRRYVKWAAREGIPWEIDGFYVSALKDTARYQWTPSLLRKLVVKTQRVKRATKWIRLSGWHPNWPLVERFTKAEKGLGGCSVGIS